MATEIVDERLVGALHVRALTLAGLRHDRREEHLAIQAGTAEAIFAGGYDGDATLADLMKLGSIGLGTVQHLDGELIVLDGEAWAVRGDGRVDRLVAHATRTPFAVLVPFDADVEVELPEVLTWKALCAALDDAGPADEPVFAVRIDGRFEQLHLRSVVRQEPPYRPLAEVVEHQTQWSVDTARGTVVGFRFPATAGGIEVPGWHLHFISGTRDCGGHVLSLNSAGVCAAIAGVDDLHVELPAGVALGVPGAFDAATAERVEGDGAGSRLRDGFGRGRRRRFTAQVPPHRQDHHDRENHGAGDAPLADRVD